MPHAPNEENRTRQIFGAGLTMALLCVCIMGLILGWRFLPGLLGEWLGILAGIISTPVFLESSFFILGFSLVICINHWNRKRDGDEFVSLEDFDEISGEKKISGNSGALHNKPGS